MRVLRALTERQAIGEAARRIRARGGVGPRVGPCDRGHEQRGGRPGSHAECPATRAVPVGGANQSRGLEGAGRPEREVEGSVSLLRDGLGFREIGEENGWQRYGVGEGISGQYLDLRAAEPNEKRGAWGTGTIHHLAWRVAAHAEELTVRHDVLRAGAQPTPGIDRFWCNAVYVRDPGRGPLALADWLGVKECHEILVQMQAITGDDRYRPSQWLRRRAQLGLSATLPD